MVSTCTPVLLDLAPSTISTMRPQRRVASRKPSQSPLQISGSTRFWSGRTRRMSNATQSSKKVHSLTRAQQSAYMRIHADPRISPDMNRALIEFILKFHAWSTARPAADRERVGEALSEEANNIANIEREQGMSSSSSVSFFGMPPLPNWCRFRIIPALRFGIRLSSLVD